MSTWSIMYGGETIGTFAELGLSNLKRTLVNCGVDKVTFDAPKDMDGAPLFNHTDTVIIKKDNTIYFQGRVVGIYGVASASEERIVYELAGPWWYFERTIYQQTWKMYSTGDSALTDQWMSRVILCQNAAGARITTGAQITAAIQFAIDEKAIPVLVGTVDPAVNMPFAEAQDLRISDLIVRMIQWSADAVCYFDYTTATPTFHCRSRANLTAVTAAIADKNKISSLAITPRYDLLVPGVVMRYEITGEYDGEQYRLLSLDTAGTTTAFNTVVSTVELAGSRTTFLKQAVTIGSWLVAQLDPKAFLKSMAPALAPIDDADITIDSFTRLGVLPYYLKTGTIHDWMPVTAEDDVVTIKIKVKVKDPNGKEVHDVDQTHSFKFQSTDAVNRTYRKMASFDSGEAVPTGIAAKLYASWSALQYDGTVEFTEAEISANVTPGATLNITGGRAEWASMNAQIQTVVENVDQGITEITIGPARQLGPDALLAMFRAFRTRVTANSMAARITGKAEDVGGANLNLGAAVVGYDPSTTSGETRKLITQKVTGSYTQEIKMDPSLISKTDADVSIQPRELDVCVAGVEKKMIVMCSEAYEA